MKKETSAYFSSTNIGNYPIQQIWYEKEKLIKRKSKKLRWLERKKKKYYETTGSARNSGFQIISGVENWFEWCNCNKKCCHKWSYEWLLHMRMLYINQTEADKRATLNC